MRHWRKVRYALIGPLMIWVVFIIAVAFLGTAAIGSLNVLPLLGDMILRTAGAFCVLVLAPLAALAEIAPPFVTKEEVRWRNRNADQLFEGSVSWEDVPFLPPVLNRIRSTKALRRPKEEEGDVTAPSGSGAKAS